MLLQHTDHFVPSSFVTIHSLCIITCALFSTSIVAQHAQLNPNQMMAGVPTVATFSIPPQTTSPPTPSVPNYSHHMTNHQSTTNRPLASAVVSTTSQSPVTTTITTSPPLTLNSMIVSRPASTSHPNIDDLNGHVQGRTQGPMSATITSTTTTTTTAPTPITTTNSRASTTPVPPDEFAYSTFPPETSTTSATPNRSFEDSFVGNQDLPPTMMHEFGVSTSDRIGPEHQNHNPLMEASNEPKPQTSAQDMFALNTPSTSNESQPFNNMPMLPSLPPINPSATQPREANYTSSFTQIIPSAINNLGTNTSTVINSEDSSQPGLAQEGRTISEERSQVQPNNRSISNTTDSTNATVATTANTSTNDKKVQILKPKSKFKCASNNDCTHGLCHVGQCFCSPGFTGEACDININECLQHRDEQTPPCFNGGKCEDAINGFLCICPPGFRGDRCQDLADMCSDSPCLNNASCTNYRTNYTCTCAPGFEGRHCELDINDCAKNPCQNGATCQDLVNGYKCECPQGFMGTNCEININDCSSNACQNNATCRDLVNDYECECPPGFEGKNCEENINECASSPCSPHGECSDMINGFTCDCHDGWTGKQCELDINECESNRPVCLNQGVCVNLDGSYQCNCKDGFTGRKCSEISDYCKAVQPCKNHGICKNLNSRNQFHCECNSGFLGKHCDRKRNCTNECSFDHAHCVNNVTCACLPGRREERTMCEYVSKCDSIEGDLCLHGGICENNLETGGYHCTCQDPWYGPVCQFRAESQFDAILLVVITCVGFLLVACGVVSFIIFRSVRKARATRGTYSPSTQEKFGNSASDLLKPPIPERLI